MQIRTRKNSKISEYAWEQIRAANDDNIVAIGFGTALRNGVPDLSRGHCIRFYVKSKSKRKHRFPVPQEFNFTDANRSARGVKQKHQQVLPTDVVEYPQFQGSARRAFIQGNGAVSTGLILRWREQDLTATVSNQISSHFGVLTVAHGFENEPIGKPVLIQGIIGDPVSGLRIYQSTPRTDRVDLCVIELSMDDCFNSGLLLDPEMPSLQYKSFKDLTNDVNRVGASRQQNQTISFRVLGTIESAPIQNVGPEMIDLLHVEAGYHAFEPGTSGCVFNVLDHSIDSDRAILSALQLGASEAGYKDAVGQSLETALIWIRANLSSRLFKIGRNLIDQQVEFLARF